MPLEDAFRRGVELAKLGRNLDAVPYFRRALAFSGDDYAIESNLASVLNNGAQETRRHLGRDDPAVRSTFERVLMLRESFDRDVAAERLATNATQRALVMAQEAQTFAAWGLPRDALARARAALDLDPSQPLARAYVAEIQKIEAELEAKTW